MPSTSVLTTVATCAFVAVPGPWGPIHLAAGDHGIIALEILTPPDVFAERLARHVHAEVAPAAHAPRRLRAILDRAVAALDAYFDGDPAAFDELELDLGARSGWDRRVLEGVRQIRRGSVTSYGRLARLVGSPGAARAAGGAVGRNPIGLAIPCHRVIAGDGTIGGYGGDWWGGRERLLEIKRELLEREGVILPATALVGLTAGPR